MTVVQANILGFAYTAVKALLEVFLIGFSGYIFARNGTLNKPTLKSLSLISVNLLTPALMFSKMTETLDPALLMELWNEPMFYFIYGGFSLLWSRIGSRVLRLNNEYARLCDVATFFSNTNTLPVSLIKSIALSSGSQFLLKDADDTPLKVAARGVSYAMIFATLNNILRWSFGVALMGGLGSKDKQAFNSVNVSPRTPAFARSSSADRVPSQSNSDTSGDELAPLLLGEPALSPPPQRSWLRRVISAFSARVGVVYGSVQPFVTPPVYAIAAAFIVITIKPLHHAFMDSSTMLYTLWSAIDMCGDACVPLILISLGGQLGLMARERQQPARTNDIERCQCSTSGAEQLSDSDEHSADMTRAPSSAQLVEGVSCVEHRPGATPPSIILRTATDSGGNTIQLNQVSSGTDCTEEISDRELRSGVIMVLVGRFVFVPTLAIVLISTLRILFPQLLPIMVNDPVYMLTLLILSSTPPAINLITVSQATGKFETEAAEILFYGYVLGIFVLAIEVSGFLWLTSALSSI
ncbi:hypothetical protein COEREDRAFT_80450 [Coemansia reversa NRRL 1564]|uniref:Auxin efflux carrier n=1 Tax=Coemansia reversa (strain ATCC 12441 / NRRL 1564) TaxID=763665 RepID=A0A2G5BEJ8_COERN|nr:hypothetical protein COEREDRAFT_80450 [Coemansia reversa NRRL 1564]|eukprot:PIA17439.1 hypothetical protein COEREDRAFT_80450 [Coemansia reversa NRRL 1564]